MEVSFRTILIKFYFASIFVYTLTAGEPYYGMCANPTCSDPIGRGMAVLKYYPGEHDRIGLDVKDQFDIFVKDYGEKKNLFGIMINGQRGYVPKNVVQEQRSFVKQLVPAAVDFLFSHVGNQNQEGSQIHFSMSRQEVIHHVSPDTYSHDQNFHSNYPSENFGHHSDSGWAGESSHVYSSPHVHVRNSHIEATVTSQISNVAQQPNTWESSHIHAAPENLVHSSYFSSGQHDTYQNTPPQQQYSESMYTHANQRQATYQNAAPEEYSQSMYHSEYHSPEIPNTLQSSFQPQEQGNFQHTQNSYSDQMDPMNTAGNQAQNFAPSPRVEGSLSSFSSDSQFTPNGVVSAQHTNHFLKEGETYHSMSSLLEKPTIDISGTIAALKAQGFDERELEAYFSGDFNPSHILNSGQEAQGHGHEFPSQQGYSSSDIKIDPNYRVQQSSMPPQAVQSSEEKGDYPSSSEINHINGVYISPRPPQVLLNSEARTGHPAPSEINHNFGVHKSAMPSQVVSNSEVKADYSSSELNRNYEVHQSSVPLHTKSSADERAEFSSSSERFHSSSQFPEPPVVSESFQQTLPKIDKEEEDDDSGEVMIESEDENLYENGSNELSSSEVTEPEEPKEPDSLHLEKQEDASSLPPQKVQPSHAQKTVEQTSSFISESNISPTPDTSSETIIESTISTEHQQSTRYPDSTQSNFLEDIQEKIVTPDDTRNDEFIIDDNFKDPSVPDTKSSSNLSPNNSVKEKVENIEHLDIGDASTFGDTESDYDKSAMLFDNLEEILHREKNNETDRSLDKEQGSDLEKILNISDLSEAEQSGYLNAYQIRNLKGEQENQDSQSPDTLDEAGGNASSPEFDFYEYFENTIGAIRSFVEAMLLWIPEPLYSTIMELESKGISPRVPVFTALSAIPCLFLIIALVYVKERSKEQKLIVQLAFAEKNVYALSAEKSVLEEKLEKVEAELDSCKTTLESERKFYDDLKAEVVNLNQELEKNNIELESRAKDIEAFKKHEKEFVKLIADNEKQYLELVEEKNQLNNQLNCQDETACQLNDQLQEKDKEIKELQEEKLHYFKANEVYEEKLTQLQQNCSQLLKEAEIWNLRVNELNTTLSEETQVKQQLEETLKTKEGEIESLTFLVESFKTFEQLEDSDSEESKSKKEKLECLLKSADISIMLERKEEENKLNMQKLGEEKAKILDMEVELLDAKSEIDKLKLSYNQALQDKTEAQTKLEVLTNYFKDKEIQLQKQLGAQEVFREKREKDADSAERRIVLIEQENTSYKSQVASMKQEMEETERNLKSQIAAQEKKAHENWIAARAAERKLEDMKQEVTQLRQKLTLLERDQGNFINASRDDIIRPIPQRIAGVNDDTLNSQDINNSMDEPPGMYRMPLPPMMLPGMPQDRPLPPLPLPPPPFEPPPMFAPPPFGPFPRDPMFNSEFRVTPPEFARGRASTPPRGRQSAINDNDMGPRQSSPLGSDLRESRNSTPPHSLPDFHDIPPPPPRPFYPPHRFPFRPPFRRDFPPGPPRPDYPSENSQSRGAQPSSGPQDSWAPSNSRV